MKRQHSDRGTLIKEIEGANQDPKFVKAVKEFINITSNRRAYKV